MVQRRDTGRNLFIVRWGALIGSGQRITRALAFAIVAAALVLPAAAQADLLVTYDHVSTTGQLDIGLVNASTGQSVALPASVNTAAREFHPSLSPDGTLLTFVRQTFEQRGSDQILQAVNRIHVVNLRTGADVTPSPLLAGDDRTTTPGFSTDGTTIVAGRHPNAAVTDDRFSVIAYPSGSTTLVDSGFDEALNTPEALALQQLACVFGTCVNLIGKTLNPATGPKGGVRAWELEISGGSQGDRAIILAQHGSTEVTLPEPGDQTDGRWSHPTVASGQLVAAQFERAGANGTLAPGDLHFLDVGSGTQTADFPGINTPFDEHFPAFTADGRMLAFLRTTSTGHEQLVLYDTDTAQPLNAMQADLGPAPPSGPLATLRRRQGGISIARISPPPTIVCDAQCLSSIATLQVGTAGTKIGIFIQHVSGTGTKPSLRFQTRIPLGFHQPGRFNAHLPKLPDGTYQLVARTLNDNDTVKDISAPLRVTVRHGKFRPTAPTGSSTPTKAPTTYVGSVEHSHALVGIATANGRARAYVCDGKHMSVWFDGKLNDGVVTLTSPKHERLIARLDGHSATGTFILANGRSHRFSGRLATGHAGLYRGSSHGYLAGWILLANNTQRGAISNISTGTLTTAPRLTSTALLDGRISITPIPIPNTGSFLIKFTSTGGLSQ